MSSQEILYTSKGEVAEALYQAHAIKFGEFILKSGIKSPVYIDLGTLQSHSRQRQVVVDAYANMIDRLDMMDKSPDYLASVPTRAIPIVSYVAYDLEFPQVTPRPADKTYRTKAWVDGDFVAGAVALVMDDIATTGGSLIETADVLKEVGLKVVDCMVLVDRQQGGGQAVEAAGYRFHAFITMREILKINHQSGLIDDQQFEETMKFFGFR